MELPPTFGQTSGSRHVVDIGKLFITGGAYETKFDGNVNADFFLRPGTGFVQASISGFLMFTEYFCLDSIHIFML
jgi:hypothetical protein